MTSYCTTPVRPHYPNNTWVPWSKKSWFRYVDPEIKKQKEEAAKQRKEMIESQFSAWDGAHINLTSVIKESMNDPKSFQHIETRYIDNVDHLIVVEKFRGKNAFGGYVRNYVKAKVSLDGIVLEILDQGDY